MAPGWVEVWRTEHGAWRWCFVDPEAGADGMALLSHLEYDDRGRAESAARTAYPGLPLHVLGAHGPGHGRSRSAGCRRWLPVAALALTAVVAAAAAGAALGRHLERSRQAGSSDDD